MPSSRRHSANAITNPAKWKRREREDWLIRFKCEFKYGFSYFSIGKKDDEWRWGEVRWDWEQMAHISLPAFEQRCRGPLFRYFCSSRLNAFEFDGARKNANDKPKKKKKTISQTTLCHYACTFNTSLLSFRAADRQIGRSLIAVADIRGCCSLLHMHGMRIHFIPFLVVCDCAAVHQFRRSLVESHKHLSHK